MIITHQPETSLVMIRLSWIVTQPGNLQASSHEYRVSFNQKHINKKQAYLENNSTMLSCFHISYTLWLFNVAMENGPLIDVL